MDFAVADLALNFLCVAETFVNIVYVIGALSFYNCKDEIIIITIISVSLPCQI